MISVHNCYDTIHSREEGNIDAIAAAAIKVENLVFLRGGILGEGSFGTVRLARRKLNSGNESSTFHRRSTNLCMRTCPESEDALAISSISTLREYEEELVAVKIFSKSNLRRRRTIEKDKKTKRVKIRTAFQQVEREISLMKKLSHPNLVQLYEVIDSPETDNLYLVLEYMPLGEILTFQEHNGTFKRSEKLKHKKINGLIDGHFDEEHAALYFVDILHGLAYLHKHHVCHCDIKPENILLSNEGVAKVGDFGVSHIFEEDRFKKINNQKLNESSSFLSSSFSSSSYKSLIKYNQKIFNDAYDMNGMAGSGMLSRTEGTWCFWAPEMCNINTKGSEYFSGYMADIWAAGICLYIFVTGRLPFFSKVPLDLFDIIEKAEIQYSNLELSDSLINLLQCCLKQDPKMRAGLGDCLHHPFLQIARKQRIRELAAEFQTSRQIINISNDDMKTAFRIVPARVLRSAGKKISEGVARARNNLRARMPSLASSVVSKNDDASRRTFEGGSKINSRHGREIVDDKTDNTRNEKKNRNAVVVYEKISDNLINAHTSQKFDVGENDKSSMADTHISRLSSSISFESAITDEVTTTNIRSNQHVNSQVEGRENSHPAFEKQSIMMLSHLSTRSLSDEDSIKHESEDDVRSG